MVFAVDVGNTNIVLGAFDGDDIVFTSRIATESHKTCDQYAIDFLDILRLYGCTKEQFDGAVLSTVVPPLLPALRDALDKLFGCRTVVVGPGIKTGLNIKIDDPAILGADLVCGAVAALDRFKPPLIIFDLGTATTVSGIDRNGNFLGGSIIPGVRVSLNALSSSAAQLPFINTELTSDNPIGKNSIDSMRSGSILGTASMIDGMTMRYKEVLGEDATVIATGGLAPNICRHCRCGVIVEPNLLLDGLKLLYKKNR